MKADEIINKARREIKDFIVYETQMICLYKDDAPNYGMGDDYKLSFGKDLDSVTIEIYVYDSYGLESGSYHFIPLNSLVVTLDEDVYVTSEELNYNEIHWKELKTDDLVKIAKALEYAYNKLIKK